MPSPDPSWAHSGPQRPPADPPPLRLVLDRTFPYVGRVFLEHLLAEMGELLELDLVWLELGPQSTERDEGALKIGTALRFCWPTSIVPPFEASSALIELEPNRVHFLETDSDSEGVGLASASIEGEAADSELWDTLGGVPFDLEGVGRGVLAFADAADVDPSLFEPYLIGLLAERLSAEARRVLDERWLHAGLGRDPQTGLPGHRLFLDRVDGAIQRALRCDHRVVLVDLAIDDGGLVPDERDALMEAVGQRLRGAVRGCDAVGRLATARFGVLLEGIREWRYVEAVALSVYHALTHSPVGAAARLEARAGVAVFPDDGNDGLALIERARRARLELDEGVAFASVGGWQ